MLIKGSQAASAMYMRWELTDMGVSTCESRARTFRPRLKNRIHGQAPACDWEGYGGSNLIQIHTELRKHRKDDRLGN